MHVSARSSAMLYGRTAWLAFNEGSGSNNEAAVAALEAAFEKAECRLGRRICFPRDDAPTAAMLGGDAVDMLVIFAGDGTINSIVTGLYGWDGAVLVLPGGTMNLLSHRMHGDADAADIIARAAEGRVRRVRPAILRSRHGDALTGMLAGPGTAWNDVREAMRETDIVGMVSSASEAIGQSTSGAMVACREPDCGRDEGYTAIMLTPHDEGVELNGFYVDGVGDYLKQGLALARRDFRSGPHELLGTHPRVRIASTGAEPIGLLIDGEPAKSAGAEETIELARCEVDLLATVDTAATGSDKAPA